MTGEPPLMVSVAQAIAGACGCCRLPCGDDCAVAVRDAAGIITHFLTPCEDLTPDDFERARAALGTVGRTGRGPMDEMYPSNRPRDPAKILSKINDSEASMAQSEAGSAILGQREPGYYWARALGHPPEVALWDGDVWFFAADGAGYVPEAVAVLSPRLMPPAPNMHAFTHSVQTCIRGTDSTRAPAARVTWGVPRLGDGADLPDDSGLLHGGGG